MTNTKALYACSRCAGTGRLSCFSNVLGGVCFKCGGSGKQAAKPAAPSMTWAVLGHVRATGEQIHLYNVRARTPAEAIRKARATFAKVAARQGEYATLNSLDNATAVNALEYWAAHAH